MPILNAPILHSPYQTSGTAWHITLGTWMRDYVFYPFSLSKGMNKFGKFCKNIFGKHVSRVLPVCIANLLVFFLVGVWHGPAWKFIV